MQTVKAVFPTRLTDWINTVVGTNAAMAKHDGKHAEKGLKSML